MVFSLPVPAPSVSIAVPSPQPIYEGTSKVLICTATVSAAADTTDLRALFEWIFEGSSNYFSESRFNFSERQISQFAFESVLELSPISLRDSGEYECAVVIESSTQYVEAGEGNSTASVSIDGIHSELNKYHYKHMCLIHHSSPQHHFQIFLLHLLQ